MVSVLSSVHSTHLTFLPKFVEGEIELFVGTNNILCMIISTPKSSKGAKHYEPHNSFLEVPNKNCGFEAQTNKTLFICIKGYMCSLAGPLDLCCTPYRPHS